MQLPSTKSWFVLAVIALALLAVLGRYAVIPVSAPASADEGQAVLLDRWTGQTMPIWTSPTVAYDLGGD